MMIEPGKQQNTHTDIIISGCFNFTGYFFPFFRLNLFFRFSLFPFPQWPKTDLFAKFHITQAGRLQGPCAYVRRFSRNETTEKRSRGQSRTRAHFTRNGLPSDGGHCTMSMRCDVNHLARGLFFMGSRRKFGEIPHTYAHTHMHKHRRTHKTIDVHNSLRSTTVGQGTLRLVIARADTITD